MSRKATLNGVTYYYQGGGWTTYDRGEVVEDAALCARLDKIRARMDRGNVNRRERDGVMRSLGLVKTPYGWE